MDAEAAGCFRAASCAYGKVLAAAGENGRAESGQLQGRKTATCSLGPAVSCPPAQSAGALAGGVLLQSQKRPTLGLESRAGAPPHGAAGQLLAPTRSEAEAPFTGPPCKWFRGEGTGTSVSLPDVVLRTLPEQRAAAVGRPWRPALAAAPGPPTCQCCVSDQGSASDPVNTSLCVAAALCKHGYRNVP